MSKSLKTRLDQVIMVAFIVAIFVIAVKCWLPI
jgi:hypothetical protein